MKKYFLNTLIFVILVVIIGNVIQYLTPYYWANPGYSTKIRFLNEKPEQFNTLFFGSSRIYRHIDPVVFDELSILPIKSFNTGYAGTFVPESYYLLENFLKKANPIERGFILVELQTINQMPDENLHTTKMKYFLTPKEYLFAVRTTFQNPVFTGRQKSQIITNYTIQFLEKLSGIGLLADLATAVREDLLNPELGGFGLNNRGHLALETTMLKSKATGLINRNQNFLKDTSSLESRERQTLAAYQDGQLTEYSTAHLHRIEKLISLAEKKGYYLIFISQPKLGSKQYEELLPLYNSIDDLHKIDLGDPERYPEFYEVENSFDIGHFNDAGVEFYTTYLAAEFNELLKKDPAYASMMNSD